MWEVKVKIKMTSAETKEWYDEEAEETVQSTEWGDEEEIAELKVKVDHTAEDEEGEYLPDDEVTADKVAEEVAKWQKRTGLVDDETTIISQEYSPEKARKVK